MNESVGKICPFCKTEIKEDDEVKVCPACGIPHHLTCWTENKGCTTFGCTEQHYDEQHTNPTDVCVKCGAPLGEGQEFCHKCGTPKGGIRKKICNKCGAELQDGQDFCPKCGQKADLVIDAGVTSAINQFNAGVNQANQKAKKKPIKIIVAIAIVLAVVVAGVLIIPKLFVSVEELCARGDYIKAYEKAAESEKQSIKAESIAAERSAFSADNLKDPSSFKLRDAYYNEGKNDDGTPNAQLVLYLSGANSYGANVSSYWLYTWSNDKNAWEYFCSVSDLTDEEYKSYDDDDTRLEKLINNLGRISIRSTMSDGIKLSKNAIQRINNLFDEGKLDSVEPVKMK